jgi:hypothetical protein
VDAILRQVPIITLPGTRRIYMRCGDVAECIDRYLYDEATIFGEGAPASRWIVRTIYEVQ